MNIAESTSFSASITEKDSNGMDTQVVYLNATLNGDTQVFTISVNVTNKALMAANGADVQAQYSQFETAVKNRAKELGYVIFA